VFAKASNTVSIKDMDSVNNSDLAFNFSILQKRKCTT